MTISLIITLIQALFATGKTAIEIYDLIKDWKNHEVDGVTINEEWIAEQWNEMKTEVSEAENAFDAA